MTTRTRGYNNIASARAAIERKLGKRDSCKLQYATYARRLPDGTIEVKQHATVIVTHFPDGSVRLNNGGYFTKTTRDRIEFYSGVRVMGGIDTRRGDGSEARPWEVYTGVDSALYSHRMRIPPDGSLQEHKAAWALFVPVNVLAHAATEFGTLHPDGSYARSGSVKQSDMLKCPHVIMVFGHYRADGTCRCDDPAHVEMAEWGYVWDGAAKTWVAPPDDEEGS